MPAPQQVRPAQARVGDMPVLQVKLEEAAPSESNLVLVSPYYSVAARYDSRALEGFPVVSDVQLYLDLRLYPIHGEEQAQHLFEKRLAPKWHLEAVSG